MHKRRTISQRSELIYDIHNFGLNADTREIFLNPDFGVDNDEAEVDYRMATVLLKNVRFLDSQSDNPILIHMCTCGGSWEYGMAIYDAIQSSHSLIYLISYAHARSMSSVILQAADYRILSSSSYVMIHEGMSSWDGSSKGFVTAAEHEKLTQKLMLEIYVEKCKNGPYFKSRNMDEKKMGNFLQKQMDKKQDWYLTPEQAIEYGFADYILGKNNCPSIKDLTNYH